MKRTIYKCKLYDKQEFWYGDLPLRVAVTIVNTIEFLLILFICLRGGI